MNKPTPQSSETAKASAGLPRLLCLLALGVTMFDFCFWKFSAAPGISVAVFFSVVTALIILSAPRWSTQGRFLTVLIFGSIMAAIIETSLTNTVTLLCLIVGLAGEAHFQAVSSPWARWQLQIAALIRAPGRLFWLARRLLEFEFLKGREKAQSMYVGILLTISVLVLALIFGLLLANGNVIFSVWTGTFFDETWQIFIQALDLGRISFWIFGALLLLPLLHPVISSERWWRWSHNLPRFTEKAAVLSGCWPSLLALGIMNLLFFMANAADFVFLWSGHSLPPSVTYAQFVHEGTEALIMAVLLSAFVLTLIFQQSLIISKRQELKALAYVWMLQNLFLLLSVALRLKLYIDAYDMTVARLSLFIFLGLVAAGYSLLAFKIYADKSLPWLLGGTVIAVVLTFYIVQFLNLAGWSAEYNVTQWEKDRFRRDLDVGYLHQLGPAAWPALYRAHQANPALRSLDFSDSYVPRTDFSFSHWREWSLRAWLNRPILLSTSPQN